MAAEPFPFSCLDCKDNQSLLVGEASIHPDILSADYDSRNLFEKLVILIPVFIIAFLSVAGNSAVIAVVFMYEELRDQVSNVFIVSLAFTDLCSCLAVMVPSAISIIADKWILGKAFCNFQCLANYSLTIVTYWMMVVISMDRTEAVLHPLHYSSRVTRKRVIIAVNISWVFSWGWCMVPVFSDWIQYDYWEAACGIDWTIEECRWWVWIAAVMFVPPFFIIIASSVIIIRSAEKSNKNLHIPGKVATVQSDNEKEAVAKAEKENSSNAKLVKSLIVLIVTFNACVTPFVIVRVGKMAAGIGSEANANLIFRWINIFSSLSLYTASATNPFIYAIFRKDFRNAFRKLFRSISRKVYPAR